MENRNGFGGSTLRQFEDDKVYEKPFTDYLPIILLIIIIGIVIAITGITAVALIRSHGNLNGTYRKADPEPQQVVNLSKKKGTGLEAYTELGQMRVVTRAEDSDGYGSILIVAPWFTYPEEDTELFEEIVKKERMEKSVINEYFANRSRYQLLSMGEENVKNDILDLINQQLVLGKIEKIYFSQYLFIE